MTHYEILGIRKTATSEEIKNAYKQLVKKYHPDVYPGDKTFAEKKTQEINEAYDVLSDPDKKREYDDLISPHTTTSYTPPDYSGYTYTPNSSYYEKRKTSKRNAQAQGSKYSYENYKKTYESQGAYDYQKRYTDYHRSKTPNSNYSTKSQSTPDFSDGISNMFSGFTNANKLSVLYLIVIFFVIFFIVNIFQIKSLLDGDFSSSTSLFNNPLSTEKEKEQEKEVIIEEEPNYSTVNPYLDTSEKDTHQNNKSNQTSEEKEEFPALEDFDINDVFTDAEIMEAYQDYGTSSFSSFEEFKEALRVTYYQVYILPLRYSY